MKGYVQQQVEIHIALLEVKLKTKNVKICQKAGGCA